MRKLLHLDIRRCRRSRSGTEALGWADSPRIDDQLIEHEVISGVGTRVEIEVPADDVYIGPRAARPGVIHRALDVQPAEIAIFSVDIEANHACARVRFELDADPLLFPRNRRITDLQTVPSIRPEIAALVAAHRSVTRAHGFPGLPPGT